MDGKSKTPFQDFIESLDKMNSIPGKLIVVSTATSLVQDLVQKYGLPEDPDCVNIVNLMEQRWKFLQHYTFPPMMLAYIKVLCWQCAVEETQPLSATMKAFMLGVAFGQVTEFDPT